MSAPTTAELVLAARRHLTRYRETLAAIPADILAIVQKHGHGAVDVEHEDRLDGVPHPGFLRPEEHDAMIAVVRDFDPILAETVTGDDIGLAYVYLHVAPTRN